MLSNFTSKKSDKEAAPVNTTARANAMPQNAAQSGQAPMPPRATVGRTGERAAPSIIGPDLTIMGNLISAHGGGVDKRMGDGIMVIFNDPLPCEDPAGDAVRLAVAMRERMVGLCKTWKRHGHRLGFGVGISFGYATIGMVGSEGRYDYTASGTSVNLAARLCGRAEDGEILLSPRAYIAVEDDFRAESNGEVNLKGIREPVEVFRLTEPGSDSASG